MQRYSLFDPIEISPTARRVITLLRGIDVSTDWLLDQINGCLLFQWLPFVNDRETRACLDCQTTMMLQPNEGTNAIRVILFSLGLGAVISYFTEPPARSRRRRRRPNRQRLEAWKRPYVYQRDGRHCSYCGAFVPWGTEHIDHSVSRRNGGTNHLNNLRLACAPCNLAKGSRNARQFRLN